MHLLVSPLPSFSPKQTSLFDEFWNKSRYNQAQVPEFTKMCFGKDCGPKSRQKYSVVAIMMNFPEALGPCITAGGSHYKKFCWFLVQKFLFQMVNKTGCFIHSINSYGLLFKSLYLVSPCNDAFVFSLQLFSFLDLKH